MKRALAEEDQEDPECTFHPKISEQSQQIVEKNNRPNFIERNELWMNQKEENLRRRGENREDKELLLCTFTPYTVIIPLTRTQAKPTSTRSRSSNRTWESTSFWPDRRPPGRRRKGNRTN